MGKTWSLTLSDSSPGAKPTPLAPSGGIGGAGGGLLRLEAVILWLFRRLRPLPRWRRKNGRRWVLDSSKIPTNDTG